MGNIGCDSGKYACESGKHICEGASYVCESERRIPVRAQVDVIVAGGGLAGVAAAVAAARAGAKTMLVERNGFPGGVATAGMCCSVFNCYYAFGKNLIVKGIPLEFANELARCDGPGLAWHKHKGHIIYDIEKAKLVLTELLEKAGVEYLFDTLTADVVKEGNQLKGIVIESKSGREALLAKVIIDATGDSDVAHQAGVPLKRYKAGEGIRSSYLFRVGNVDVDRFVQYFADNPGQYPQHMDVDWTFAEAAGQYKETGTFLFPHGGGMQMDIIRDGISRNEYIKEIGMHRNLDALQMHAIRSLGIVHIITGFADTNDLDIAKISRAMTDGKRMAFHVAGFFRKYMPGFDKSFVIGTADDLGTRTSRWIDGDFLFTGEMKTGPSRFEDAIGRGVVEKHHVKHGGKGAWAVQECTDEYFEIPYRCMLPRSADGLIMGAGRSVSASNPALLRVMALTMAVGQGAGAAAAVSVREGMVPRNVDIKAVQDELRRQGVEI